MSRFRREARRLGGALGGNAAIEFALIAPIFLMLLFGSISYGHLFWIHHDLQQLAAEAARSAVSGLSDSERDQIARNFIARNLAAYAVLDPTKLQVATVVGGATDAFRVTISYDLTDSLAFKFGTLLPMPQPNVQLSAVVQRGGY